ncbi:MAG: sensory box protein, partial [Rhodocyclales bacterium]|nr:sensory box protein [Rhodocyclales bacterium]
ADHAPVIIMVTAHGREALAKHIEDEHDLLGGFLVKPATASMLFDAVIEASSGLSHSATRVRGQAGAARLAGLRLLVVEDTLVNQQVARELLLGEGASVEIAAGGRSGIEKALQADPPFDAVLMDIQMPDVDGYTATRKIREHVHMQSLPIIAMTANAMPADKAACIAAGMNDHIGKPIDLDGVVQTILRYCRSPRPAQTRQRPNLKIDLDAALQRLGNNKPLYESLVGHFATDTATMPQDFQYHLQQGDHAKASGLMHALKGIASTLGAMQLAEYASEIETKIDAADSTMDAVQVVDDLHWFIAQSKGLLEAIANVFHAPSQQSAEDASLLDVAALKTMLDDLDVLLQGANMQARSVFMMLQQRFGPALGPGFKPLSEAMNRLDFKSASVSCALLRASLS